MPRETQNLDGNFFIPLDLDARLTFAQRVPPTLKALDDFRKAHPNLIVMSVFNKDHGLYVITECRCSE